MCPTKTTQTPKKSVKVSNGTRGMRNSAWRFGFSWASRVLSSGSKLGCCSLRPRGGRRPKKLGIGFDRRGMRHGTFPTEKPSAGCRSCVAPKNLQSVKTSNWWFVWIPSFPTEHQKRGWAWSKYIYRTDLPRLRGVQAFRKSIQPPLHGCAFFGDPQYGWVSFWYTANEGFPPKKTR